MDQNQSNDSSSSDLQQAIDNINNPTNNTETFSEPVAAPSSIPEGDSGQLGDPVGPFPMPETDSKVDVVTPGPEPIAPLDPISIPDLSMHGDNSGEAHIITKSNTDAPDSNAPIEPATPTTDQPTDPNQNPDQNQPQPNAESHDTPTITTNHPENPGFNTNPIPSDSLPNNPLENNSADNNPVDHNPFDNGTTPNNSAPVGNPNAQQIKESALRDLVPILSHVNVDPSQKFKICQDIFEDLHDYSVLDQAYSAASEIQDEEKRADSLLYLIESIDSM